MTIYHSAIILIWAFFLFVWLVTAAHRKLEGTGRSIGWSGVLIRLLITVCVLGLFSGPLYSWVTAYHFAASWSPLTALIGDILAAIGIIFAVAARLHLGRNWGMPMSKIEGGQLITSGPYAYVRHPIYAGVILALLGTALVLGPAWLILPFLYAAYFIYSATREEARMLTLFPNEYPAYRARTKFLIPFLV